MYATPHASVALVINIVIFSITKNVKTTALIGIPLSIFSHWLMDFLGERGMGLKATLIYEKYIGTIGFYLCSLFVSVEVYENWFLNKLFWVGFFFITWVSGNLLDLIDKKMYLSLVNPKKYPATFYFHKHKSKDMIKFTLKQTKIASIISVFIAIICTLILNS